MSIDSPSTPFPPVLDAALLTHRRIRHITSLQIRNLTPFPLRDAVTSALSHPVEQTVVEAADDLGPTVSKRRPRKSSNNTAGTRRSLIWDESALDTEPPPDETRGRTVSFSKDSTIPSTSPTALGQSFSSSRASLRARRRANSMASSISNSLSISGLPFVSSTSSKFPTSAFLPNHSQQLLENVIESRLVETFITLTFPNIPPPIDTPRTSMFSPNSVGARTPTTPRTPIPTTGTPKPPKSTKVAKEASVLSPVKPKFPVPTHPPSKKVPPKLPLSPTQSLPPRLNGVISAHKKVSSLTTFNTPVEAQPLVAEFPSTPSYFSHIHRPSTNPQFPLDVRAAKDIPPMADTAAHVFKVEVWGRTVRTDPSSSMQRDQDAWKLLSEWDIDLMKLEPLPDDVDHPVQLPSNTIVVTLSPPGRSFYLPQPEYARRKRPSTPTAGYSSDPESGVTRAKREPTSDIILPSPAALPSSSRRRRPGGSRVDSDASGVKSATWQDLFKLATLQSLIQDNESSLNDVITKIDEVLKEDELSVLKREISQRELRVQELHESRSRVFQESEQKRQEIAVRSAELKDREALLSAAQEALDESDDPEIQEEINVTRHKLLEVQQDMTSIRTSLISALSSIFPIELLSPPDLLFTILDAPLPIPLTVNDPAPPLCLPEFREVTEDSVATALGHAAQVVNILAAYMGKTLVYPVTCIGSRSLVRDGISSMVGPRMFPLFSKGVDTYRFEYGVFLLNKDIEMLMSERDLRAMDMRHTLPNLKNLLLTLSHDDAAVKAEPARRPLLRMTSLSGLETPSESRSESPVDRDVSTPRASHTREPSGASGETHTPTASGTTTPTQPSLRDESRKSKLLGFVALPDFLRTRYASTSLVSAEGQGGGSGKGSEDGEGTEDNGSVDEADRVTIHGS